MRTQALIIKKQNTNEYDQLVTCYTQELGKLTAIAKSVLKPHSVQALQLGLMNLVEFELVSGRGTPIITGAHTIQGFSNLKTNLLALAPAYFFLESIDRIVFDYERDDRMWEFLTALFIELDKPRTQEMIIPFFRHKQKELLGVLGYLPARLAEAPVKRAPVGASLTIAHNNGHTSMDTLFEHIAQTRFSSLRFLYRVLSENLPAGRQV